MYVCVRYIIVFSHVNPELSGRHGQRRKTSRPKINRGQIDGGDHSPLAPSSTIHSVIVESPDTEQQLSETVREQAHIHPSVLPTYASTEDIEEDVNYWKSAVICCVLGANPPYDVLARYVNRIWKDYAIDKILLIKRGLYLVRFTSLQDAMTVAQRGIYHFDHKPFIVKAWNPELEINVDPIASLPMWIQLPELDIKYWGLQSLS
ncbi:hypothetical protein Cgig2_000359 [Carnegiea gigantea]|uniref:DUF4283 domain-containing protein n=1 Tax=Carnegiea gigantea TaxID=171969 RepID=A0A9Q1QBG6_9CARY|nr:hypothetical protein Cgig2_000359 [Carnegiea gigantea]